MKKIVKIVYEDGKELKIEGRSYMFVLSEVDSWKENGWIDNKDMGSFIAYLKVARMITETLFQTNIPQKIIQKRVMGNIKEFKKENEDYADFEKFMNQTIESIKKKNGEKN